MKLEKILPRLILGTIAYLLVVPLTSNILRGTTRDSKQTLYRNGYMFLNREENNKVQLSDLLPPPISLMTPKKIFYTARAEDEIGTIEGENAITSIPATSTNAPRYQVCIDESTPFDYPRETLAKKLEKIAQEKTKDTQRSLDEISWREHRIAQAKKQLASLREKEGTDILQAANLRNYIANEIKDKEDFEKNQDRYATQRNNYYREKEERTRAEFAQTKAVFETVISNMNFAIAQEFYRRKNQP